MDKHKQLKIEAIILVVFLLLLILSRFQQLKQDIFGTTAEILGTLFGIWIIIKIGFWIYKKFQGVKK